MSVSLEWLGVSTYRLVVDDLVIFLDAYIDRNPLAPPVGIQVADVQRADYVLVGHSHFDHLWGAERIAHQTGATIIGSHESVRLMEIEEVPDEQLVAVAGGERIRLSDSVSVRVFPSQHSCIWSTAGASGRGLFWGPGLYAGGTAGEPRQPGGCACIVKYAGNGGGRSPQDEMRPTAPRRGWGIGVSHRDPIGQHALERHVGALDWDFARSSA